MVDKSRLEFKVGIFVFIALIILAIFVLMIGDFRLINPGYTFKVVFGFANGITISSPVRLSGVEVGEVKAINIGYDKQTNTPQVLIEVWVRKEAKVPVDSRVWVNMLGLLGEKYIEIIPGKDYNNCVTEGTLIRGEDPVAVQELTDLSRKIAIQLGDTVSSMNVTLSKLNTTIDSVNTILVNVEKGQGNVGKLFFDDSLYNNMEELFGDLKKHPWKLLYRDKSEK